MYEGQRQRAAGGDGIPTLLEILYAQEDLWVLRSIMGVIERANEGATTRFSAAVKEIHSIEIGRNAAQSRGQLSTSSGAGSAAGELATLEGGGAEYRAEYSIETTPLEGEGAGFSAACRERAERHRRHALCGQKLSAAARSQAADGDES